ncbi:MAG: hypothetical protein R3B57_01570 [Phycisphaerales bacterium]
MPERAETPPKKPPRERPRWVGGAWLAAAALLTLGLVLAARVLGPSDLAQNLDQSKTMALTADIVVNGHWALPSDSMGETTHKPPLMNWIAAPLVAAGVWTEWAFKLPSILGALATFIATGALGARLLRAASDELSVSARTLAGASPIALGFAASLVWIASPSAVKHAYFCRPDMLFTACVAWGWYAAVRAGEGGPSRAHWALLMWVLTGAALLAKGPMALILPAYALLAPLVIRDMRALPWHAWLWGPAIAIAMFCLWLVPAWLANPEHVGGSLIGFEFLSRLEGGATGSGPLELVKKSPEIPGWFVERLVPWSIPALLALIVIPPTRWRRHPLAPAILWVLLVMLVTALIRYRGASYLLPAYPGAAVLAAFVLLHRRSPITPRTLAAAGVVVALLITGREVFLSRAARTGAGDRAWAFAREARRLVGDDPVAFVRTGDDPIPTMMRRVRPAPPTPEELAEAVWVVLPIAPDSDGQGPEPALRSDRIQQTRAGSGSARSAPYALALYHRSAWPEAWNPPREPTNDWGAGTPAPIPSSD